MDIATSTHEPLYPPHHSATSSYRSSRLWPRPPASFHAAAPAAPPRHRAAAPRAAVGAAELPPAAARREDLAVDLAVGGEVAGRRTSIDHQDDVLDAREHEHRVDGVRLVRREQPPRGRLVEALLVAHLLVQVLRGVEKVLDLPAGRGAVDRPEDLLLRLLGEQ